MQQTQTAMAHHHVPGLPASPTLTNPDMILPYEFESTPSPPRNLRRPWQGAEVNFSIGLPLSQIGGPLTPTTPIIYGNGTMLSDIGEVTEAESTPGQRTRSIKGRDLVLNSSPTMGYNAVMKRTRGGTHERKVSVESTSTITSQGQTAELFEGFDDSVSMDDSNFQGDDEESIFGGPSELANQFRESRSLVRKESGLGQDEDSHSSAALSRRAELILANAKKRLDKMEGNLERARTSFSITPSHSMSSINSSSPLARSTPSPQQSVMQLGAPPSRHRTLQNAAPDSPGHSRVSSENNIPPSSLSTRRSFVRSASAAPNPNEERAPPSKATTRYPVRSTSAAPILRESKKGSTQPVDNTHQVSALSRDSPPYGTALEPLSEDETTFNLNSSRTSIAESYFSSTAGEPRALTRSTSTMQMRDLRDQMKDLKGKISSLRDRAREENMRRRSLQSLRTPSPFTAAEQWYTQGIPYNEKMNSSHELMPTAWNNEAQTPFAMQPAKTGVLQGRCSLDTIPSIYEDVQERPTQEYTIDEESALEVHDVGRPMEVTSRGDNRDAEADEVNEADDMNTECGSDYGEEVVDYEELDGYPESEASDYHESLETHVSHEDREDAFDYQTFFLHSAMGRLIKNRRDSFDSCDSDDSAETARGIIPPSSLPKTEPFSISAPIHERKASSDSISTIATFATASEGNEDDESSDPERYSLQNDQVPVSRSPTPVAARRATFGGDISNIYPLQEVDDSVNEIVPSPTSPPLSFHMNSEKRASIANSSIQGKQGNTRGILKHTYQQPSVASLGSSTGTTRSFPLIKPKTPTPPISINGPGNSKENLRLTDTSQSHGLASPISPGADKSDGDSPDHNDFGNSREESPVNMLAKEDQVLVERVVASLGKCVLAMQEVSRGSTEGRVWRRRLDDARRVLEGDEGSPDMF